MNFDLVKFIKKLWLSSVPKLIDDTPEVTTKPENIIKGGGVGVFKGLMLLIAAFFSYKDCELAESIAIALFEVDILAQIALIFSVSLYMLGVIFDILLYSRSDFDKVQHSDWYRNTRKYTLQFGYNVMCYLVSILCTFYIILEIYISIASMPSDSHSFYPIYMSIIGLSDAVAKLCIFLMFITAVTIVFPKSTEVSSSKSKWWYIASSLLFIFGFFYYIYITDIIHFWWMIGSISFMLSIGAILIFWFSRRKSRNR